MDQLKRMAVFAEVVAAGSLSGAARQLGMTPSAVSQHLRRGDLLTRWGGEEYLVLLNDCKLSQAIAIAESLLEEILLKEYKDPNGGTNGVTTCTMMPLPSSPALPSRAAWDDVCDSNGYTSTGINGLPRATA